MEAPRWMSIAVIGLAALFVVMAALKLLHVIAWAWWIVALPLLGPLAFLALVILFVVAWSVGGSH